METPTRHKFYLSNSTMHDWLELCPRVWKAKHWDKKIEFVPSEMMIWGQVFESICIGSSVRGEFVQPTDRMKMSVYYPRIKKQAEKVRRYLRALGGRVISRQSYVFGEVTDANGQVIPICGGFDIVYEMPNGRIVIIDIKLTGDTENDFGKFAWNTPEKMDLSQAIQYSLLYKILNGVDCGFEYWVFDNKEAMKESLIEVQISEGATEQHIARLSEVYNQIMFAAEMNDWGYINTYANCSVCPCKCPMERVMPEKKIVEL